MPNLKAVRCIAYHTVCKDITYDPSKIWNTVARITRRNFPDWNLEMEELYASD